MVDYFHVFIFEILLQNIYLSCLIYNRWNISLNVNICFLNHWLFFPDDYTFDKYCLHFRFGLLRHLSEGVSSFDFILNYNRVLLFVCCGFFDEMV